MKQAQPATTSPRTACIHGRRFTALQPARQWTEEEWKAVELRHHSNVDKTTTAMLQSSSRQNATAEALH